MAQTVAAYWPYSLSESSSSSCSSSSSRQASGAAERPSDLNLALASARPRLPTRRSQPPSQPPSQPLTLPWRLSGDCPPDPALPRFSPAPPQHTHRTAHYYSREVSIKQQQQILCGGGVSGRVCVYVPVKRVRRACVCMRERARVVLGV